jgi:hypothetical protein
MYKPIKFHFADKRFLEKTFKQQTDRVLGENIT